MDLQLFSSLDLMLEGSLKVADLAQLCGEAVKTCATTDASTVLDSGSEADSLSPLMEHEDSEDADASIGSPSSSSLDSPLSSPDASPTLAPRSVNLDVVQPVSLSRGPDAVTTTPVPLPSFPARSASFSHLLEAVDLFHQPFPLPLTPAAVPPVATQPLFSVENLAMAPATTIAGKPPQPLTTATTVVPVLTRRQRKNNNGNKRPRQPADAPTATPLSCPRPTRPGKDGLRRQSRSVMSGLADKSRKGKAKAVAVAAEPARTPTPTPTPPLKAQKGQKPHYRGVSYISKRRQWQGQVTVSDKVHLGNFKDESMAAYAVTYAKTILRSNGFTVKLQDNEVEPRLNRQKRAETEAHVHKVLSSFTGKWQTLLRSKEETEDGEGEEEEVEEEEEEAGSDGSSDSPRPLKRTRVNTGGSAVELNFPVPVSVPSYNVVSVVVGAGDAPETALPVVQAFTLSARKVVMMQRNHLGWRVCAASSDTNLPVAWAASAGTVCQEEEVKTIMTSSDLVVPFIKKGTDPLTESLVKA